MNKTRTNKTGRERINQASTSPTFAWHSLFLDFTEKILARMRRLGKKKLDLANAMGTTPSYVSQIFSGAPNLTLETMVKIAHALDAEIKIDVRPRIRRDDWQLLDTQSLRTPLPQNNRPTVNLLESYEKCST